VRAESRRGRGKGRGGGANRNAAAATAPARGGGSTRGRGVSTKFIKLRKITNFKVPLGKKKLCVALS
jgi:hypothetical protein